MAAFDEFKRSFAFTDAAFSRKEDPDAVNIQQDAVPRHMGSQRTIQVMDCKRDKFAGNQRAGINRNIMRSGDREQIGGWRKVPADDQAGHRIAEIPFEDLFPHLLRLFLQIRHLDFSDHLGTLKRKEFIKTAELHAGTVQIRRPDIPFRSGGRNQRFQLQRSFKIPDRDQKDTSVSILKF